MQLLGVKTIESKKPVVLVGNKADSIHRKVHFRRVTFHQRPSNRDHMVYFETSERRGTNLMDPFIWLAQNLYGDNHLTLALVPVREQQSIWLLRLDGHKRSTLDDYLDRKVLDEPDEGIHLHQQIGSQSIRRLEITPANKSP
jgi:hypothetical protein